MKKLIFIFGLLVFIGTTFAENTPAHTVQEIINKMKETQSPVVVLDYVNWEKAFQRFPAVQKEQLKVSTPDQLKKFFDNMLRNPSAVVRERINQEINKAAPEQQENLKKNLELVVAAIAKKEDEMKKRISSTSYEVGAVEVKGGIATVMLTQTYNGEKKTEKVILEKEGERWMLPTADLGNNSGQGQAPATGSSGGSNSGTQF